MNRESVLSRQILTYMMLLTFTIIAISILGSWFFTPLFWITSPAALLRGKTSR